MLIINFDGIEKFLQKCENKKVVCYGVGRHFMTILNRYKNIKLSNVISYLIDADEKKHGKTISFGNKEWVIMSVEDFRNIAQTNEIVLLITIEKCIKEVVLALDSNEQFDGVSTYIASYLSEEISLEKNITFENTIEEKIPRKIHYCWFGGKELPEKYKKYIDTWRSSNPDYEIIRWDETNYDVGKNKYMKQAYDLGKWAFVSDYARADIINEHGGIYLDCDIEVIKSFNPLLKNMFFCGFEYGQMINLGVGFGSIPSHPYLKDLLNLYSNLNFIENGVINYTPCTVYQTELIEKYGIKRNGFFQNTELVTAFPKNVFSPISYYHIGDASDTTISIHHYDASWIDSSYLETWKYLRDVGKWLYERYKRQNNY